MERCWRGEEEADNKRDCGQEEQRNTRDSIKKKNLVSLTGTIRQDWV